MKILAYTSPARGHLFPLVPILDELAGRGHTIAVRTLSSQVAAMAERGFEAEAVDERIEAIEHDDYLGRTPAARLKRAMATFGVRSAQEVPDLRAAISEHRPDALLVDCNAWGATAVAEASGRPWAQWFPYPLPLPSRDVPPFGPGLAPAAGPLGRARDAVLRPMTRRMFERSILPALNATRRNVGVKPFSRVEEMFTSPPLILYMTAEPFEYPRSDWPASVRMVGPSAWEPAAEPPAWLEQVRQPLILVSSSSELQDDARLVRTALDAFAGEDVVVVATMPAAELPGAVPANARVERFVPHGPVLARAACAITHGGAGVTQKALAAGVPVCVVPFGRDQLEVARRVEVAGAGTRLPAARLNPERLRAAVRQAMAMRAGAARVAEGYGATGEAATAADSFEALAASWPARPAGATRATVR
jgi:MGT family glycosyltransferase